MSDEKFHIPIPSRKLIEEGRTDLLEPGRNTELLESGEQKEPLHKTLPADEINRRLARLAVELKKADNEPPSSEAIPIEVVVDGSSLPQRVPVSVE